MNHNLWLIIYNLWLIKLIKASWCLVECGLCICHLPPWVETWPVEVQLVTFFRLIHVLKVHLRTYAPKHLYICLRTTNKIIFVQFFREHHPMRYNRMTEVLKTVASVKLSSTFLLKSYFLKKPLEWPLHTVLDYDYDS